MSNGNVGLVPLVVPAGGTANVRVRFGAQWANRLEVKDENGKTLQQYDNPNGGQKQFDAPAERPLQLFLDGSHRDPGDTQYTRSKWLVKHNDASLKVYGWEDFGDMDFADIVVTADISFGTRR